MVGDMDASSLHDESLIKPQDDFLEVHAPVHVDDVCNEVDSIIEGENDNEKHDSEYKSENLDEVDSSLEPHHLARQMKVSEEQIMAAMKHFDDTHALVKDCCWRDSWT